MIRQLFWQGKHMKGFKNNHKIKKILCCWSNFSLELPFIFICLVHAYTETLLSALLLNIYIKHVPPSPAFVLFTGGILHRVKWRSKPCVKWAVVLGWTREWKFRLSARSKVRLLVAAALFSLNMQKDDLHRGQAPNITVSPDIAKVFTLSVTNYSSDS